VPSRPVSSGVFWINAETIGGLTSGFVAIASALRLAGAESNDQERVVKFALAWLNGHDGWLLIFDNVDDRRECRRSCPRQRAAGKSVERPPVKQVSFRGLPLFGQPDCPP
jgi:hypothetical protein